MSYSIIQTNKFKNTHVFTKAIEKPINSIQNSLIWLPLLLIFVTYLTPVYAAPANNERVKTQYQYAVKALCSLLTPHQDGSLARGTYRTSINIHNPTDKKITFVEKVALAGQPGTPSGPFSVTPFKKTVLEADGAVEFNCFNIAGFFCPINGICVDFAVLDGFFVIKSPVELDVIGVYTARHTDSEVETVDLEIYEPRKIKSTINIAIDNANLKIEKRLQYPPVKGNKYGRQMCGGIAELQCPKGQLCVDDPADNCDPTKGGADCSGLCTYQLKP